MRRRFCIHKGKSMCQHFRIFREILNIHPQTRYAKGPPRPSTYALRLLLAFHNKDNCSCSKSCFFNLLGALVIFPLLEYLSGGTAGGGPAGADEGTRTSQFCTGLGNRKQPRHPSIPDKVSAFLSIASESFQAPAITVCRLRFPKVVANGFNLNFLLSFRVRGPRI